MELSGIADSKSTGPVHIANSLACPQSLSIIGVPEISVCQGPQCTLVCLSVPRLSVYFSEPGWSVHLGVPGSLVTRVWSLSRLSTYLSP